MMFGCCRRPTRFSGFAEVGLPEGGPREVTRSALQTRREKLRRLANESFNVVVIGGGINGAGIAREAALRGLRTALLDKGDFASGTSSRSSKLIHGGLRYLERGEIGLVLEASRERDLLRRKLAPHLVRSQLCFFPVYRSSPVGYWKLRAALLAYDVLAAFRNISHHRGFLGARAQAMEPALLSDELVGGCLYYDCVTDDSRLVLETVLAAEAAGAICLNYVSVERFEKTGGRVSRVVAQDRLEEGSEIAVPAARVVNATGPWLDRVRRLDDPAASDLIRQTRGTHLVLPRDRVGNRNVVVLRAIADQRVLFVTPWQDEVLIGTTDTDFEGSPDRVVAECEDVDYLLETVNHYFPAAQLGYGDVISAWAGLRALVASPGVENPSEVSREEQIFESSSGLISLGGGKLTTHRRIAIRVVDRLLEGPPASWKVGALRRSGTDREPLPGAVSLPGSLEPVGRGERGEDFLRSRYGYYAEEIAREVERRPDLRAPLSPPLADPAVEAWWGARAEMAVRVDDLLRRRSQIALRTRDGGSRAAPAVAREMAGPLSWNESETRAEADRYREAVELPPRPGEERRKA